jgi:hypothetical protein
MIGIAALVATVGAMLARSAVDHIPLRIQMQSRLLHHCSPLLRLLAFLPVPLLVFSGFVLFPRAWRLNGVVTRCGVLYILAGLHIALLHVNISRDPGMYGRGPQFLIILFGWPLMILKYLNDLRWHFIMKG